MDRFKVYTHEKLFSEGAILILDMELGILTLLTDTTVTEQQILTPSEMYIVEALLDSYPDYCPHEVMLSAMTGKSLEKCRERVLWGLNNGAIDLVMHPVRNLLARCRMKLNPFDIHVKSMLNTGYIIVSSKRLLSSTATRGERRERE